MSLSHSSSTGLLLGSYRGQSTRSTQSATHEERLCTAASQGDLKMVAQMLHAGADGDAGDAYGVTPLMHACMSGSLPIVTELIEYSVHVNAKDKYGQTALHFAASFGHLEIVKYLLEHKANVHAVTVAGQTPLMKAVYNTTSLHGDDVIILLLKYKAKPNAQADDGRTALHIAIEHDNMAAVRILLSTPGIDINIATKDGRTPIHMAAYSGSTIMLETLVMAGADVDAKTKKGETIYDIQPHNETLRLPPAALKQRAEEAVKRGRQQAADEKKRTLMNAELEQKSKINMSKHITLTYDEEQKQLEEMTASRRNQFYQKMSQVQREKGDKHIFHYDYSNPDSIDLSKPEPEKEPIMIDTPVVNEIIPTSVKQAEKPIVIPHHVPILEQKSQHLDLSHDVTRIPAPSEHPHHTAGVHYVHGEYKPTSKPTTPNSTTRTISTLSTTTPAPASATTTATIITSQAYSIKINNNNNPAYATTTTPQVTSIITGSEKKIYTINLGGKK